MIFYLQIYTQGFDCLTISLAKFVSYTIKVLLAFTTTATFHVQTKFSSASLSVFITMGIGVKNDEWVIKWRCLPLNSQKNEFLNEPQISNDNSQFYFFQARF